MVSRTFPFPVLPFTPPLSTESPRGQSLATAYDNGFLILTNAHTGKTVHQIDCSAYSKSQICCLGWGINFTDGNKVGWELDKFKDEVTLDDMISQNPRVKSMDSVPDLPLDLALLDVEASLPKLSPLSPGGIEYVPEMEGITATKAEKT